MLLLRFGLHTLLNKAVDDDADDSRHDNICLFFLGGGGETFPPLSRLDSILQDFLFKKHEQGIVIR